MKRVQKSGKDTGSTLGSLLGMIFGFYCGLFIYCLDMFSLFSVIWALSSIIVGYPSSSQVDVRVTIVSVLYIILRIIGYLVQNRLTK